MTNKEFYGDKLLAIALEDFCHKLHVAFYDESCLGRKKCEDCEFSGNERILQWLNAEHEKPEPPLLENGDNLKPGDWISVKDRLPADGGRILIAVYGTDDEEMREESGVFFALYKNDRFFVLVDDESTPELDSFISRGVSILTVWGMRYEITHWMPLPELPMKGE